MDHLSKVADRNRVLGPLQVPYLLSSQPRQYTPLGVSIFCDMQVESLKNFPAKDPSSAASTSLFQSFLAKPISHKISRSHGELLEATQFFLYFGLLVEAFYIGGVTIDLNRFITQNNRGKPIVTTSPLTEYICYWHLNVDGLGPATKKHHLDQLFVLFGTAAAWLTAWASRLRFVDPPPSDQLGYEHRFTLDCHHASYPRAQVILLSIRILCETLHTACKSAYSSATAGPEDMIPIELPEHPIVQSTFMQTNYEFVDRLMLDAGKHPNFLISL
jgi:hypothetical protein